MADPILPRPQAPIADASLRPMREWHDFFRDLLAVAEEQTDADAAIAELQAAVAELQSAEPDLGQIFGNFSVEVQGILGQAVALSLRGDVLDPGASYYYGTDADGTKGWYERLLATLADVDLAGLADGDLIAWDATAERFVPSPPSSAAVPYFIPSGQTFRVAEYTQALFSMPIDVEGFLDVEGYLIEVD